MITTEMLHIWVKSLPWILGFMSAIWLASVILRNVGIVDMFRGSHSWKNP